MNKREKILELRQSGMSYDQIAKEMNCSKSVVSYHLDPSQRSKIVSRTKERRKDNPVIRKLETFQRTYRKDVKRYEARIKQFREIIEEKRYDFMTKGNNRDSSNFSIEDVMDKITKDPHCYLTGEKIDIHDQKQYSFDHKIPASRGGDNSLENLGVCLTKANKSKADMTLDEYLTLCKQVLSHHGYSVIDPE